MFLTASLTSFLFTCICYSFIAPHYTSVKQKAWIVTFLASAAMSFCSLPFLRDFLSQKGDILAVRQRALLARAVCGSFQGFLLSDLVIGSIEYPQQISPLMGWAHHIIYAFLLPFITRRGSSFLWPKLRNDILYVFVFFWMRIALHATLLLEVVLPRGRYGLLGGSFTPACLFTLAFILHTRWFMSSAKGTLRRVWANSHSDPIISKQNSQVIKNRYYFAILAKEEFQPSKEAAVTSINIDSTLRLVYFEGGKVRSL